MADVDDVRWLLPIPWVLAGLAGLLATLFSRRYWASPAVSEPNVVDAYDGRDETMTDVTDESR